MTANNKRLLEFLRKLI